MKLIKSAFEALNFKVKSLIQLSLGPETNRRLLPLYYAQLHKTPNFASDYYSIRCSVVDLMRKTVKVEKYGGRNSPAQCYTCKGFYHFSDCCTVPSCVLNLLATIQPETALQLHRKAMYALIVVGIILTHLFPRCPLFP